MNGPADLSDDKREQYEQQWQDLPEKVILVQILAELQRLNQTLSDAETDAQSDAADETAYRCRKCTEVVEADARERHARSQHKAPADMVDGMFEEVE